MLTLRQIQVMEFLKKWKVCSVQVLHHGLEVSTQIRATERTVSKLELMGLIQSFRGEFNRKFIHLTKEGMRLMKVNHESFIKEENLWHDTLMSSFGISLKNSSSIDEIILEHDLFFSGSKYFKKGLSPDGIALAAEKVYALELELHIKSRTRYFEKWRRYFEEEHFSKVLYVVCSKNIFKRLSIIFEEFFEKTGSIFKESKAKKVFQIGYYPQSRSLNCLSSAIEWYDFTSKTKAVTL